jgi:hypothetical protein
LTVGETRGIHRGFGTLHIADEADRMPSRKPPAYTGDRAEDIARQAAEIAKSYSEIYTEGDRVIFRSSKAGSAVVTQIVTDSETADRYYSIVTVMPSVRPVWGNPVWRAGRGVLPADRTLKPVAPEQSPSRESQQPDRQSLWEVQTEHFDLSKERERLQAKRKTVAVTTKRRRVFKAKDDT